MQHFCLCHNCFVCLFFIKKVLTYETKWNTFYSDNAHVCLIAIAGIAYQIFLNAIVSIEIKKLYKLHDDSTTTKSYSLSMVTKCFF